MNRVISASPLPLALALFTAVLLPAGQDPVVQDPPEEEEVVETPALRRDIFGRLRARDSKADGLRGMWQLIAMDLEGYPEEGLHPTGYMLITDGFISFQLHAYYDEDVLDDDPYEDGYQTFMAEYELEGGDRMICTTLLGSYLDEADDILDYEPVGLRREFTLERDGRFLTLKWGGDNSMTFAPRLHQRTRRESIYGKQRGERSGRGTDLFGRERTRGAGTDDEDDDDNGR